MDYLLWLWNLFIFLNHTHTHTLFTRRASCPLFKVVKSSEAAGCRSNCLLCSGPCSAFNWIKRPSASVRVYKYLYIWEYIFGQMIFEQEIEGDSERWRKQHRPPPWVSRDGLQSQQDQQKRGVMSNEAHIQLNGYQMCREENGKTGVDPECVCVPYDGVKLT